MTLDQEQAQAQAEVLAVFDTMSDTLAECGRLKARPLIGGVFGSGRFVLASAAFVKHGLDEVMYFVVELESGATISAGASKSAAMDLARQMLTVCDRTVLAMYFGRRRAEKEQAEAERRRVEREAHEEASRVRRDATAKIRSIPKRRREIFDASEGKCHYCGTALTLDGKWHVDHKTPRALGGDNAPGNLVASCAPCNHEKRDTTDQEYLAKRAAKGKASA